MLVLLILNLLFSIISAYIIGSVILELAYVNKDQSVINTRTSLGPVLKIPVSYLLGTLFISIYMMSLSLWGISFSYSSVYIVSLCFLGIYIYILARKIIYRKPWSVVKKASSKCKDDPKELKRVKLKKIACIVFIILILFNIATVLFFTYIFPVRFWDAISSYSLKAKAFFIDGGIFDFYSGHGYTFSHYSYPLYLPLVQAWTYQWLDMGLGGMPAEALTKTVFPLFYISILLVMLGLFKKRFSLWLSLLFTFIFSSLPVVLDHGYIEYNNLVFSCVLLLGSWFFYGWIRSKAIGDLILTALFFGLLFNIRTEGFLYAAIFLFINIIYIVFIKKEKAAIYKKLLYIAIPLILMIVLGLPWYLIREKLGIGFLSMEWLGVAGQGISLDTFDWNLALRSFFGQLSFNIYDSTRAYFGSSYGPIWMILIVLFFSNIKKYFKDLNWVYLCFILAGLISVFISLGLVSDFSWSTERYILSVFPVSYYWVLKGIRS